MTKLIIIIMLSAQLFSCTTAIQEEKYVAEQYPIVDGNIEVLIYATGIREATEKFQMRETSPYQVHIKFRTKDEKVGTLNLVSIDIPRFLGKVIIGDKFNFGRPSENPHVLGYQFSDVYSTKPIKIDFEKTAEFDVIISYSFFWETKIINKKINVKMKKQFRKRSEIMTSIIGV